ncbi:MAG TPA: adenylate/guanylate cyclase domain-containing protein [Pirellulales bacterium]|nr:adenylate/guanylate cyclase domain-containing protein [Pirellulales bacterium]
MPAKFRLEIYRQEQLVHADEISRPVELGRQQTPSEPLFQSQAGEGVDRLVVAPLEERTVSRRHLLVEPLSFDLVRITNLTSKGTVQLEDAPMEPGSARELGVPYQLSLGNYRVRFLPTPSTSVSPASPPPAVPPTAGRYCESVYLPSVDLAMLGPNQSESLIKWLQEITIVLQSAAHSEDFFQRAARAVVDLIGLDTGRVLLFERQRWKTIASHAQTSTFSPPTDREPSHRMLERMRTEEKTMTRQGASMSDARGSLMDVEAVVVSPIVGRDGHVIGALYGDRFRGTSPTAAPEITKADVLLMETLACGVGAGLARLEQERAALEAQVRFEQFFTPELARQLTLDPNLLAGRDTEVTLLFCDIRGFSSISERLGAAGTMEWINDVLGTLSECVLKHRGVLVDYIGDELIAMWGAPVEQPDHPALACQAAIDIWQILPEVSRRWFDRLGAETRVGIGINTGLACVGNIGSQRKFKYGALGTTVNLCSRVQGASKYLQTDILLTAQTRSHLGDRFAVRRLCQARVVNIAEPVTLFELRASPSPDWPDLCRLYEEALSEFEQRHWENCMTLLRDLANKYPDDGPSLVLLTRVVPLRDRPDECSTVWELPGK